MSAKKQTTEASPLTLGTMSVGAGVLIKGFENNLKGLNVTSNLFYNIPVSHFLIGAGIITMGISLWNFTPKITETLTICGLYKEYNDKIYESKVIKTVKKDGKKIYHLTLPVGLCLSDYEKKKEQIEQTLGKKVKFEYILVNSCLKFIWWAGIQQPCPLFCYKQKDA